MLMEQETHKYDFKDNLFEKILPHKLQLVLYQCP